MFCLCAASPPKIMQQLKCHFSRVLLGVSVLGGGGGFQVCVCVCMAGDRVEDSVHTKQAILLSVEP